MRKPIHESMPQRHRSAARRRGAAMTETVLVLPLVFVVLGLLLFFGFSFAHLQHATVADRYEAWRRVAHAPGPGAIHQGGGQWNTDQLNQTFFAGRARIEVVDEDDPRFPTESGGLIRDEARSHSVHASQLADRAIRTFPDWEAVAFRTSQTMPLPLADRMSGTVQHRHLRLDNEWKYANGMQWLQSSGKWMAAAPYVRIEGVLRDQFLQDLNTQLRPLADAHNPIARSLRSSYEATPPYRGPDLPASWR